MKFWSQQDPVSNCGLDLRHHGSVATSCLHLVGRNINILSRPVSNDSRIGVRSGEICGLPAASGISPF